LDDPDFYAANPHPALRQLRTCEPVYWCERGGFWALTRYVDVRSAARDARVFSSAGNVMIDEVSNLERAAQRGLEAGELMLRSDPPRHTKLRRVVQQAFAQSSVQQLQNDIRHIVEKRLNSMVESGGTVDFVSQFSQTVPMDVVCLFLGLPAADAPFLKKLASVQAGGHGLESGQAFEASVVARRELFDYLNDQLAQRRRTPTIDLLTVLAHAQIDDQPLHEATQQLFAADLLIAGTETTDATISGGLYELFSRPDQLGRLRRQPDLIENAVEEMLRFISPAIGMVRMVTEDVRMSGKLLRRHDHVALLFIAANRDESVWQQPDEFDVERANARQHLAFGFGRHTCIGIWLAKLELRIVFQMLLERCPDLELVGEPVPLASTLVKSLSRLPVRIPR
jgi:cytochrome P450